MKKNNSGFTLVELMVVISIIAVLAAIGVTTYASTQKVARDGKRIGDLDEIQKAIEQYYAINQSYPTEANYTSVITSYFTNGTLPKDPSTAANYTYRDCSTSTSRYNVCSTLESCGSKCNLTTIPAANSGCTAAPAPAASQTVLCRSNISTN